MGEIDANMDHDSRNLPKKNLFPSSRSYLPLSRAATDPIDYYSKGSFFTERHSFSKLKAALRQHYQKPAKRSSSIQTDPKELSATNSLVIDSDQSNAGTFSSAGGVGQAPDRASRGRLTRFESAFERLRAISKDGHYSLRKLLATEDDPSSSDVVLHATSILELDHGKRPERCSPQPKKRALSLETDLAMIGAFAEDFKEYRSFFGHADFKLPS